MKRYMPRGWEIVVLLGFIALVVTFTLMGW